MCLTILGLSSKSSSLCQSGVVVTSKPSTTDNSVGGRPRGPAAVSEALFAATELLCIERPPGSVTVRQIADAAGVNHGLVHHYFESKDALLAATMLRVEEEFLEVVAAAEDPADAIRVFFDELNARPTYPRLLSWMLLEGIDPAPRIGGFPLIEHLVDTISGVTDRSEARLRTQVLLAFVAGWATTRAFMADSAGLTKRERSRSDARGREHAVAIALGTYAKLGPMTTSEQA